MSRIWKKINRDPFCLISLIFIVTMCICGILAPWIAPYSYQQQDIASRLQAPSLQHWMGTDILGRDLFSRIIYGSRMSLAVGILTGMTSLILGTVVGSIAGYWGGWWDSMLMRIVDFFYIFPSMLLAILLTLLFGRGALGIMVAISITTWITQARLVRMQVMLIRELPYVESARALGVSDLSVVVKHILPNLIGTLIVSLTVQVPHNMMTESFLSFIGLGLQPPYSSWGTLAQDGFRAIQSHPHLMIYPGLVLFLTLLSFQFLGNGLRDALDIGSK